MSYSACGCGTGKNIPGQKLIFLDYNPEEKFNYGAENACIYPLKPGDALTVICCGCKTCGMGIDVTRDSDGAKTMVWPEEVEVKED